jgi:cell division protein FtsB
MSGKSSTTIERPATPPAASDRGRSRLGDVTRPIPVERRIARDRRSIALMGLVAVVIAGSLATALFVLPVKTLFVQEQTIEQRRDQLAQLQAVNDDLQREVDRLRTEDGIREAAREQLGLIEEGEQVDTILSFPPVPTDLPNGWPYSLVEGVAALRRTAPAQQPAP